MADQLAVARKRAVADARLKRAVIAASKKFGVPFKEPPIQTRREPALAAAHLIDNVAEFIESLNAKR